eukprot:TRINITY_DN9800_c0_g1_i1.p1 TRINITY_DN9800_c0_g1~~TRINITY_DN9800_c0_g1_i1.p1  ORF type:complete len:114 (+),score=7.69 TRINITY_DN9800_c0_g1_i1:576-917(+)
MIREMADMAIAKLDEAIINSFDECDARYNKCSPEHICFDPNTSYYSRNDYICSCPEGAGYECHVQLWTPYFDATLHELKFIIATFAIVAIPTWIIVKVCQLLLYLIGLRLHPF